MIPLQSEIGIKISKLRSKWSFLIQTWPVPVSRSQEPSVSGSLGCGTCPDSAAAGTVYSLQSAEQRRSSWTGQRATWVWSGAMSQCCVETLECSRNSYQCPDLQPHRCLDQWAQRRTQMKSWSGYTGFGHPATSISSARRGKTLICRSSSVAALRSRFLYS